MFQNQCVGRANCTLPYNMLKVRKTCQDILDKRKGNKEQRNPGVKDDEDEKNAVTPAGDITGTGVGVRRLGAVKSPKPEH